MSDVDARVRQAAVDALEAIGSPAAAPVAEALGHGAGEGALTALERLPLDGTEEIVRKFAGSAVERAVSDERRARSLEGGETPQMALLRDSLRARAQRNAFQALRAADPGGLPRCPRRSTTSRPRIRRNEPMLSRSWKR